MLTKNQLRIQGMFKAFMEALMNDASYTIGSPVQIKTDFHLGILNQEKKDKAQAYGDVMLAIIKVVEKDQETKKVNQGPTGILAN